MLRLRTLSWIVICSVLLAAVAPALPAYARSSTAVTPPIRQDEVGDLITDLRNADPDLKDDFSATTNLFKIGYDGTTSVYLRSGELHIAVDEENTLAWSRSGQRSSRLLCRGRYNAPGRVTRQSIWHSLSL